jgi:nitrilase
MRGLAPHFYGGDMLNVAGLQIENQFDRDKNLDRAIEWIHRIEGQADLILLPELFTCGYSEEVFKNLDEVAEDPKTGYSFELFGHLARQHKTYISFGFPERGEDGYYISQAVLDRGGELVGTYRKVHLAQFKGAVEKDYFLPGNKVFDFQIDDTRIGIATCYDFRFPEFVRRLTLECGIDFLIHPSVFKQDHYTFNSWYDFAATRAIENQIYLMSLNYAGKEYGNSVFFKPNDTRPGAMCTHGGESLLYGEVDLEVLKKVREIYPLLKDRKLEF